MEMFVATVQRNLTYLVIGGTFILILLNGTGFLDIAETTTNRIMDAAFMVCLLYWMQRQRPQTQDQVPPGGTSKTTTENITTAPAVVETTVTTAPKGKKVSKTKPKRAGV